LTLFMISNYYLVFREPFRSITGFPMTVDHLRALPDFLLFVLSKWADNSANGDFVKRLAQKKAKKNYIAYWRALLWATF